MRILGLLFLALPLGAQARVDSTERRFRFAETFVGGDVHAIGEGRIGDATLPFRAAPRLVIGGLHFWGHADFAVAIPLGFAERGSGDTRSRVTPGVETRGRYFPIAVRDGALSPFVGGGLGTLSVSLGDGAREFRPRPIVQAGAVWRTGRTLAEAGWTYRTGSTPSYATSRSTFAQAEIPRSAFHLGLTRTFETTLGAAASVRSGANARRMAALRESGRLSGPSLAIGLSSPILVGDGRYNEVLRPWLPPRPRGTPMLDLGVGWYFDGADAHVNLAYRQARFDVAGYDFEQRNRRRSVALEAYKFLFDYHGFVPFIGPVVSQEWLSMQERDRGVAVTDASRRMVRAGLTFGWDIRPTRDAPWILRTNLRYLPNLALPVGGNVQRLDQFEFNFIQFVWYPRR